MRLARLAAATTPFDAANTILKQSRDELVFLYTFKFFLCKFLFLAPLEVALGRIRLHGLVALTVLNIYNVATRLPFAILKGAVNLLAVIRKMVHLWDFFYLVEKKYN